MNLSDFSKISMNGRMAFLILCIEKYLLQKYPNKDWTKLSAFMWKVTSSYWDEWDFRFMEIIPEYLFEFDSFENSDFEFLTKDEYEYYSGLFSGVSNTVNKLLLKLHYMQEIYSYSNIPGTGDEASALILEACDLLKRENISTPEIALVSFSSFSEQNGWGNQFDGRKLSFILTHNKEGM